MVGRHGEFEVAWPFVEQAFETRGDFSDLIFAASGGHDTPIIWGRSDSLLVEGMKPNQPCASETSLKTTVSPVETGH
jgi:hypothetical protein